MKRIRTARELYCEILKSFYFGSYQKDEKLMTYQETHEIYGLAKNTIGAAYAMLQRDGFIQTNGANGTIVTFDINNPAHVARVPLEIPSAMPEDTIPYEIAMRLHAYSLYTGLMHSDEAQLQMCKDLVENILHCVQDGLPYNDKVFAFWTCVISSLDNEFLSRITDHFISRYLYLLPPTHLSSIQKQLHRKSSLKFYQFMLDAMEQRVFDEFPVRFEQHYHNYYKYGVVVFSKLEDGEIFKEQTRYGSLLEDICIKIVSGELQKGDPLPTTKHLCTAYGISTTTVNRAYGILAEMGFISRRVRSGTKLIALPDDPEIWELLDKFSGFQQRDWKDALEAILIISNVLCSRITISPDVMQQMRTELKRQHNLFERYTAPYCVSAILLSPLISSLPAGIIHKYYIQLTDVIHRVISLCTFRIHGEKEHGREIYQLICRALEAVEHGDQQPFAILSEHAMLRNAELLTQDYLAVVKNTGHINTSSEDVETAAFASANVSGVKKQAYIN